MTQLIDISNVSDNLFLGGKEPLHLLDTAVAAIAVLSRSGYLIYQNRRFYRSCGNNVSTGTGRHLKEISPDQWRIVELLRRGESLRGYRLVSLQPLGGRESVGYLFVRFDPAGRIDNLPEVSAQTMERPGPPFTDFYHGLYLADADGYTRSVNSAYEKISCLPGDELRARHMGELQDKGYFSQSVTLKVLAALTGRQSVAGVSLIQQIITGKMAEVTGKPLFKDDGSLCGILTLVRELLPLDDLARKCERFEKLKSGLWNGFGQHDVISAPGNVSSPRASSSKSASKPTTIVAEDPLFLETLDRIEKAAHCDSHTLLLGETGVGKDKLAHYLHSLRSGAEETPFVPVNCSAIPDELFESELFGYEEGAFSGARKGGKTGLFEAADGGVLFLNEISEIPLPLQAKLLSVLDGGLVRRVGGTDETLVKTRIVCATNRDPHQCMREGTLREDLYHRISVLSIRIPPLRERPKDILPLILHFMREKTRRQGGRKNLSPTVQEMLIHYPWPGNVRELCNVVEKLYVFSHSDLITSADLPEDILRRPKNENIFNKVTAFAETISLKHAVAEYEAKLITEAMERCGNLSSAAALLDIDPTTLSRKIKRYNR